MSLMYTGHVGRTQVEKGLLKRPFSAMAAVRIRCFLQLMLHPPVHMGFVPWFRQRLIYAVFDQNPESHPVRSCNPCVFNLITEFRSALAESYTAYLVRWFSRISYNPCCVSAPSLAALCASLTAWFVAAYDAHGIGYACCLT
jgi:hypothetical protein